jgi:hypothetical protein
MSQPKPAQYFNEILKFSQMHQSLGKYCKFLSGNKIVLFVLRVYLAFVK